MILRPYDPRHRDLVARLWSDSFRSIGHDDMDLDPAGAAARLEREVDWTIILGWEDETLIGFLAMNLATSYLHQLFIAPARTGEGLGIVLLDEAKRRMPGGMRLRTGPTNVRACAFYEKHGFHIVDRGPHPVFGTEALVYAWP